MDHRLWFDVQENWACFKGGYMDSRLVRVEGVEIKITNPEKMLFPKAGITKWNYIMLCARLAPFLLRYTRNRLLTTIRFPHGVEGESFYQKNAPRFSPEYIEIKQVDGTHFILLNNLPTLIWLCNLACLEFHVSFHTVDEPYFPTELVFDIDPSTDDFTKVVEVALLVRECLNSLGLDAIAKTSGASGLQLYVPLAKTYSFEETRKVGKFIAEYLAKQHPHLVTVERMIKKRGEKVYIDYLQHWYHKTLIAPYSPRATQEATVSTPLLWEELTDQLTPVQFTLHTILPRLEEKGDLLEMLYQEEAGFDLDDILAFIHRHKL